MRRGRREGVKKEGIVNKYVYLVSEVLTAAVVKRFRLWDITPCSPVKISRSIERTYPFHLQGQRISQIVTSLK
jgi:hypothetical protein